MNLMPYGTVIGFLPNKPDFCYVTDGFFTVMAHVSGSRGRVKIGKAYTLFKHNSLYSVGTEVNW
jgi:hypothetical protein